MTRNIILKEGEHSKIELTDRDTIIKIAKTPKGRLGILNSIRFHTILGPKNIAPKLITAGDYWIEMERIIPDNISNIWDNKVEYQEKCRVESIKQLLRLKQLNIIHTDLTYYNYILYGYCPYFIDWDEARFLWEDRPNKRKGTDASWFYPSLLKYLPDTNRIIRRWQVISKEIEHLKGYGTLLDVGCLYGDISAMFASDGFIVTGIDKGAFDSYDIEIAAYRYGKYDHTLRFLNYDMYTLPNYKYDAVLMLSSWTHSMLTEGIDRGIALLDEILKQCGILFFENHLFGDGNGLKEFQTEQDHINLFNRLGIKYKTLIDIPVTGREAVRRVWKLQK